MPENKMPEKNKPQKGETAMKLFFQNNAQATGQRLTGLSRYTEVLERDLKRFLFTNLMTCIGFLPFAAGVLLSMLSTGSLLLLPSCIIGGIFAGPALTCMYDVIFRGLRDAPGKLFATYKHAWKQNFRQSLIPGILFCLICGFYLFMLMMFSFRFPETGTIVIFMIGFFFFLAIFSLCFMQIALFEQSFLQCIRNSLLFFLRFFPKTSGCILLKLVYYTALVLFAPWTVFLLPLTGFWLLNYTTVFFLYDTLNECFGIEEKIAQSYPDQIPFYEDDETWLKRKQSKNAAE